MYPKELQNQTPCKPIKSIYSNLHKSQYRSILTRTNQLVFPLEKFQKNLKLWSFTEYQNSFGDFRLRIFQRLLKVYTYTILPTDIMSKKKIWPKCSLLLVSPAQHIQIHCPDDSLEAQYHFKSLRLTCLMNQFSNSVSN